MVDVAGIKQTSTSYAAAAGNSASTQSPQTQRVTAPRKGPPTAEETRQPGKDESERDKDKEIVQKARQDMALDVAKEAIKGKRAQTTQPPTETQTPAHKPKGTTPKQRQIPRKLTEQCLTDL